MCSLLCFLFCRNVKEAAPDPEVAAWRNSSVHHTHAESLPPSLEICFLLSKILTNRGSPQQQGCVLAPDTAPLLDVTSPCQQPGVGGTESRVRSKDLRFPSPLRNRVRGTPGRAKQPFQRETGWAAFITSHFFTF